MKNKGMEKDIVFGVASIIAGIVFSIISGVKFGIALFENAGFGSAAYILAAGALFGFIFFLLAIMAFVRTLKFKRYSAKIGKQPRFRIPALAAALNKSESVVFTELSRMIMLGYFGDASVDLESRELVIDKGSEPLNIPENELKTMYKKHAKFPVLPFIAALAAVIIFWRYDYGGIKGLITGGAVGLFVMIVVFRFFPAPVYFTEVSRPAPKPKAPAKTGNEELDALLDVASKAESELIRISSVIKGSSFSATIEVLVRLLGEIIAHVTEYPEKVRQLRQFSSYYLPTTVRLAESYEELYSVSDKGENILMSIEKIETMGEKIVSVFKHEYDLLFGDKAMDISAEIAVMESMIDETKADISPFERRAQ